MGMLSHVGGSISQYRRVCTISIDQGKMYTFDKFLLIKRKYKRCIIKFD